MTTEAKVRALALALPEAYEAPHFEKTSFRVRKKIFATLAERPAPLAINLRADQRALMCETQPDAFAPVTGARGSGWTFVTIARTDDATIRNVLKMSYLNVAPKMLGNAA